jgi:hypothetical protein
MSHPLREDWESIRCEFLAVRPRRLRELSRRVVVEARHIGETYLSLCLKSDGESRHGLCLDGRPYFAVHERTHAPPTTPWFAMILLGLARMSEYRHDMDTSHFASFKNFNLRDRL